MINWDKITKEDFDLIILITDRAQSLMTVRDRLNLEMDIVAVHLNGSIDLQKLLGFSDGDFIHDVVGIHDNINRSNGHLRNCFVPRCSA